MRTITFYSLVYLFLLSSGCNSKFQQKYTATEYEPCKEVISFLQKEFYRDKKNRLRTVRNDYTQYGVDFDTTIVKPFHSLRTYSKNGNCFEKIRTTDFFAILGKPDFVGKHPYYKYNYCVYFITSGGDNVTCPKGCVDASGVYDFKNKMGYTKASYCHRLEIRYRPKDNSIVHINLY
jgi:hypothetical protein